MTIVRYGPLGGGAQREAGETPLGIVQEEDPALSGESRGKPGRRLSRPHLETNKEMRWALEGAIEVWVEKSVDFPVVPQVFLAVDVVSPRDDRSVRSDEADQPVEAAGVACRLVAQNEIRKRLHGSSLGNQNGLVPAEILRLVDQHRFHRRILAAPFLGFRTTIRGTGKRQETGSKQTEDEQPPSRFDHAGLLSSHPS